MFVATHIIHTIHVHVHVHVRTCINNYSRLITMQAEGVTVVEQLFVQDCEKMQQVSYRSGTLNQLSQCK